MTLGSSVDIAAKIRATAGDPEIDVAYMDISIAKQIENEGLLEKLDFSSRSTTTRTSRRRPSTETAPSSTS